MTTEKTLKYYLSEDDKEILEKAKEILQTFDEDPRRYAPTHHRV